MKLSIIIPCYNEDEFVEDVIDKINQQPISDKEIIVVNDGSDQKTKDILEKCLNNKKIKN